MKVRIAKEELYPVYSIDENGREKVLEVTHAFLEEYKRITNEFNQMQKQLTKMFFDTYGEY